jgi:hypothetical protein
MSRCSTCGTLCGAFPITDSSSLALYGEKQCTIVSGDLYIMNLPLTVTRLALLDALGSIRSIHGSLYVLDNQYLSALTCFTGLLSVYGATYLNNPILIDTRMPSLTSVSGDVTVTGCDRLCPARYTQVGAAPSDVGCANPTLNYYVNIVGNTTSTDLPLLASIMSRAMGNLTNGAVRGSIEQLK